MSVDSTTVPLETGATLPEWNLPVTPRLVVSTALATRDFQDVHHDRDAAQSYGSQDIFVNILTSNGLVQRYIGDQLGHDADVHSIQLRLGAPAYPYDELVFSGEIMDTATEGDRTTATVKVRGTLISETATNGRDHVVATVEVSR